MPKMKDVNTDNKLVKDMQEAIKALRKEYKIDHIIISEEDFNANTKT